MTATSAAAGGEQTSSDGTVLGKWCSWHNGAAPSRPVEVIERGPGAGGTLYACRPCRLRYRLTSLPTWAAQAALQAHLGGTEGAKPCKPCNRHDKCPEGAALWAEFRRQERADKVAPPPPRL